MARSIRIGKTSYYMGILLAVMLSAISISYAWAQTDVWVDGIIRFEDRTLCSYTNYFFNKEVYPLIEQVDANGNVIGPVYPVAADQLGLYEIPLTQTVDPSKLRVTCEGLVIEHELTPAADGAHVVWCSPTRSRW
jgi:hypothetical protein